MTAAGAKFGLFELTDAQRVAVESDAARVAVAAGAGCGKTRVLTARLLHALSCETGRLDLSQIVAVTFTEKAARELRERVRSSCRAQLGRCAGAERARWKALVRGLEAAPISTFHSFCAALLERFPVESGVEPGFGVLDPAIASTVREDTLAGCLRGWLAAHHPDLLTLAVGHGVRGVGELVGAVLDARREADLAVLAERTAEETVEAWQVVRDRTFRPVLAARLREHGEELVRLLHAHPCRLATMRERIDLAFEVLVGLSDHDGLVTELVRLREGFHFKGNRATHWPDADAYEAVKAAWTRIRDTIDDGLPLFSPDERACTRAAQDGTALVRLATEAAQAFDEEKRRRGGLDFDDLQRHALSLLRNPPEAVREWVRRSVRLVLIDEFQDTDPIQDEILDRLCEAGGPDTRVFLVGDRKQSIYRFRGAQPRLFSARWESFGEVGRASLQDNFRSVPELIAFTNAMFEEVFPEAEHRLRTPPTRRPASLPGAAVEFLWAHDPDVQGKTLTGEGRRLEALWIARLLAQRLDGASGEPWLVRDPGAPGGVRPARARDVVILLRTLKDSGLHESALTSVGLDYHVQGATAFFGQQEVLDLINLLGTIEDPRQPLALAATLRSPFAGLSDEALLQLASTGEGGLCEGFARPGLPDGLDPADQAAIERFRSLLSRWRGLKDRRAIATLLDQALDETGYEAALLGEFLGERRRANVRKLVRLAREFDALGGLSLADFAARLRTDWHQPPREDQAATAEEEGDAVRIMTIHQAKGLEFPIVVVPDLNRKPGSGRDQVAVDRDLGVVLLAREPEGDPDLEGLDPEKRPRSLGQLLYRAREELEDEEEALRLFYVAVTRAQDRLLLAAGNTPIDKPACPAMRLLDERFDRQSGAFRGARSDAFEEVPEVRVLDQAPTGPGRGWRRAGPDARRAAQVAEIIERAAVVRADDTGGAPAPASFRGVFLDLDPAPGLGALGARVDRLFRSALRETDPKHRVGSLDVEALVRRLGRRESPAATPVIEAAAVVRLRAWLGSEAAARVRSAQRVVARGERWTIAWPVHDRNGVVLTGTSDFLIEEEGGAMGVVMVSPPGASEVRERLRLQAGLAALVAGQGDSLPPVGYRVQIAAEGVTETREAFDPVRIAEDLAEVLLPR